MTDPANRSQQLSRALGDLLAQASEIEAAAVVSFDGLPMASLLPATMDEDRVAAMSAALLSLGERASEGLGRGGLTQVYIEGEHGTVFLVSADDEAVLVAVAAKGAKVGMMMFEVRRAASVVAGVLRTADVLQKAAPVAAAPVAPVPAPPTPAPTASYEQAYSQYAQPAAAPLAPEPTAPASDPFATPAYDFGAGGAEPVPAYAPTDQPTWS